METRSASFRRWRALAIGIVALVVLWGVVGGLLLPPLAKKLMAEKLSERSGRVVQVDRVSVNPYTLDATLQGVRMMERDGKTPFISFDTMDLEGSGASFYRLAPVIDRATLSGLKVKLVREADNRYNFTDLVERIAARTEEERVILRKEDPARFSVSNIRVVNAAIDFDDRPVGRKHQVTDMQLAIPFVSNLPRHLKEYVEPSFAAKVNGAPVLVAGETRPFEDTFQTRFTVDVRALDVRRYLAYLPLPVAFTVESGTLDAHAAIRFTQAPGKDPTIDVAGTAALADIAVAQKDGPAVRVGRLGVELESLAPLAQRAKIKSVRLDDARVGEDLRVARVEVGGIEADLRQRGAHVQSVATSGGEVHLKRGADGALVLPVAATESAPAPSAPADEKPWRIVVDRATLADYRLSLEDAAVRPRATHRVTLESVEASGLTTEGGLKGKALAKLVLERGGSVEVDSTFDLEPLLVTAKLDAKRLDLVPFRPYMTQFSTVALKSGVASARGQVTLKERGSGVHVAYAGAVEVGNFATFDTTSREDLLNFRAVRTSGIDFSWAADAPLTLSVADIVVDRVYSRLVVNPDGKLNVQQLRTATPEQPDAPAVSDPDPRPRQVRIDRITFVEGRLNFTDHFIKPNYTADVGELQGTVSGLSSDPASRAEVDLKGSYDASSPVTIAGTVNPLAGELFVDIAAKGENIELPKLTAYSQRYAGYGIKEGKLTLDVKYHIEDGKLDGRNNIRLDRLTFGDKVESPEATTLPVLFAVNLLKDSNGQIALELPITGSLADPQFEVGALITQVLGSLLKKAVTNPFGLLAAAFGGSGGGGGNGGGDGASTGAAAGAAKAEPADLRFVDFDPGGDDMGAAGQRKLETMVKALQGRPGLTLEIAARLDAEADLRALRYAALQKKLAGEGPPVAEADYARKVRALYAAEKLPGDPAQLSVVAMELALMERLAGDAEMAALQQRRAQAVRSWLMEKGQLPAERVVLATGGGGSEPEVNARKSRVDFALR